MMRATMASGGAYRWELKVAVKTRDETDRHVETFSVVSHYEEPDIK